jgi:hypothetical protein
MISVTLALIILLATFIFMYYIEMTMRKRNFKWYEEAQLDHIATINCHRKAMKEIDEQIAEYEKSYAKETQRRKLLYLNFAEWVEALDTQTLTDELKEEIVRNANFDMD